MSRPKISFEDLEKLAQTKERTPCGKQAFTKSGAVNAARIRTELKGYNFYPVVCYDGCGREIFHVTTRKPEGRKMKKKFEKSFLPPKKKSGNRRMQNLRRERREKLPVETWENEGGAILD